MLKNFTLCLSLVGCAITSSAQITLQGNRTAQQLAERISGKGVFITNATLQCAQSANGTFAANNTTLGLDSGIVLTTGQVYQVNGPEPGVISTKNNTNGDADLLQLTGAPSTHDACVLSFDVTPHGNKLQFDYVFASEEYVNAVCGVFNDGFGFFISGPGITGKYNMAKVPNTNIPVAVNSINNGIVGSYHGSKWSNCTSMGQGAPFTQYYVDNTSNPNIAFKGMTTVLTASADVIPCNTYRLKIAIADAGNYLYDTGVFIKAGSMTSNEVELKTNHAIVNNQIELTRVCDTGSFIVRRSNQNLQNQLTVSLAYAGSAVANIDYSVLPTTVTFPPNVQEMPVRFSTLLANNVQKDLKVYVIDPNQCGSTTNYADSLSFIFNTQPAVILAEDTLDMCKGSSLVINAALNEQINFVWNPNNGNSFGTGNQYFKNDDQSGYVYVSGYLKNSTCKLNTDSVYINVSDAISGAEIIDNPQTINVCYGQTINLKGSYVGDENFNAYWYNANDTFSRNQNLNITVNEKHSGWMYFWVGNESCKPALDSVFINALEKAPLPVFNSPYELCLGDTFDLASLGKGINWYENAWGGVAFSKPPVVIASEIGSQSYFATSMFGTCESDRKELVVLQIKCCEQEMFIPNAFTPNGDGLNDEFQLRIDPQTRLIIFEVYNRWGQRVYLQQSPNAKWDGTLNGEKLDVGTYMYRALFNCSKGSIIERKGSIELLR